MSIAKKLACSAFIVATVSCLAARDDSGRSDFFYNGTIDEDAARVLVKSLNKVEGVADAGVVGDELVHFTFEKGTEINFTVLCYMTQDLDRLDFQIAVPLQEGVKPDDENLQRFLTTLNEKYAAKFFTIDSPKSPLIVSRSIYFQNHVRGELISSVIRSQTSLLGEVAKSHTEECRRFLR
jgi:hypothetical protein